MRDALKLARLHAAGQLRAVTVPSVPLEALRDLVRAREDLRGDLMAARHRISKLLLRRGLIYDGPGHPWESPRHAAWLSAIDVGDPLARVVLGEYLACHDGLLARRARLDALIGEQADDPRWAALVGRLRCMRGVDTLTAVGLIAEIGDFAAFAHPKQLASFLGLVPTESSSGEKRKQGSITKAGSSHARRLLIEAAWHYRRRPAVSLTLRRRQDGQPPAAIEAAWRAQLRCPRAGRTWTPAAPSAAPPSRSQSLASWPASSGRSPASPTDPPRSRLEAGVAAGARHPGTRDPAMSTGHGRRARS